MLQHLSETLPLRWVNAAYPLPFYPYFYPYPYPYLQPGKGKFSLAIVHTCTYVQYESREALYSIKQ